MQPVGDGGGSEYALIGLIRQLRADGWECHVAVPEPVRLAPEYAAAGATVHGVAMPKVTTSGRPWRWLAYMAKWPFVVVRLARLARRLGVDVIHSNSLHSWHGWAAALLARRPHIWHAREIVFQSRAALRLERALARRFADQVIAVSAAVAAQLDQANVTVILDEADPTRFGPDRAGRFRTQVHIPDGTPLIGSVARIDTWKGFEVLLDAFDTVRSSHPDAQLVIAGAAVDGKEQYEARLRARAEATNGVHWLGPRRDIGDVMADLDVFVQASTEPEPFGLVVVEALASGVPVVASASGGPLEILGPAAVASETRQGRLVTPGDAAELAAAVSALLPPDPSSTDTRRRRTPLRRAASNDVAKIFRQVALARSR